MKKISFELNLSKFWGPRFEIFFLKESMKKIQDQILYLALSPLLTHSPVPLNSKKTIADITKPPPNVHEHLSGVPGPNDKKRALYDKEHPFRKGH